MRNILIVSLLVVTLMRMHSLCFCQVDVSVISARAGAIRSESITSHGNYLWSFYPEIEVGGRLFAQYLSWGISWGYWTDGPVEVEPAVDFVQRRIFQFPLAFRQVLHTSSQSPPMLGRDHHGLAWLGTLSRPQ